STRSLAPFSGLNASACAFASGVKIAVPTPSEAAAARPAELFRILRRLKSLIHVSLLLNGRIFNQSRTEQKLLRSFLFCPASSQETSRWPVAASKRWAR